ncbi:MAG: hypothetical protein AAFR65_10025 [Pseudomonadota bacterium]
MQGEKVFSQKKRDERYELKFEDEEIVFNGNDGQSTWVVRQQYEQVPFDSSTFQAKNTWFRNVGFIWLAIGTLQIFAWLPEASLTSFPFLWPALGAGFVTAFYLLQRKYTFFDSDAGRIVVLQDEQHDEIVTEIEQRRNEQILSRYGQVLIDNDPERERSRFKFLLDRGVIDEPRYNEALREIEQADVPDLLEPPDQTPPSGTVH